MKTFMVILILSLHAVGTDRTYDHQNTIHNEHCHSTDTIYSKYHRYPGDHYENWSYRYQMVDYTEFLPVTTVSTSKYASNVIRFLNAMQFWANYPTPSLQHKRQRFYKEMDYMTPVSIASCEVKYDTLFAFTGETNWSPFA